MWWLLPLSIAALLVGGLALASVLGWFNDNVTDTSEYGELIKTQLKNGDYRIVAGVFDTRGHRTATQEFQTDELDDDLKDYFGQLNKVRVEL
jgi:F0F1-type ATP synthase assembly protein I